MSAPTEQLSERGKGEPREQLTARLKRTLLERAESQGLIGLEFVPAESDREGWLAVIRQKKIGYAKEDLFGKNFKVEAVSREGKLGGYLLSGMVVQGKSMVMLLSEPDRLGVVGGPMPLFIPDETVWLGTELVKTLVDLKAREIVAYLGKEVVSDNDSVVPEPEPDKAAVELKFDPKTMLELKEGLALGMAEFVKEGWEGKFVFGGSYQNRAWESTVWWLESGDRRAGQALVQVRQMGQEAREITRVFLREADLTKRGLGRFVFSVALVYSIQGGQIEPSRLELTVRSEDREEWLAKAIWLEEGGKEEVQRGKRNLRAEKLFKGAFGEGRLTFAEAVERLRK